jgi:hypothetical protein
MRGDFFTKIEDVIDPQRPLHIVARQTDFDDR